MLEPSTYGRTDIIVSPSIFKECKWCISHQSYPLTSVPPSIYSMYLSLSFFIEKYCKLVCGLRCNAISIFIFYFLFLMRRFTFARILINLTNFKINNNIILNILKFIKLKFITFKKINLKSN